MLTSADVKRAAREFGADLCGIASMDRFEGAPKQQDPRYIFPDAKACVVLAFRIPRGYFRGIEEGTYFGAYASMGYGSLNQVYMPIVLRDLCCFIEDYGFEAAPVPNIYSGSSVSFATQKHTPERSRPVRPDLPNPDILVDMRIAAFAAGLGEIGYSKMLLTPEFGPAQRIVALLTDAPLEPDPLFDGKLCDRCLRCATECSGKAICATQTDSITVAGRKVEWGKLDVIKCSVAYRGGDPRYNPFLQPTVKEEDYKDQYSGGQVLDKAITYGHDYGHKPALEAARGCIRACLAHLEETGKLTKKFEHRFRRGKPWRLAALDAAPAAPAATPGTSALTNVE
jgi:hypothetical protein